MKQRKKFLKQLNKTSISDRYLTGRTWRDDADTAVLWGHIIHAWSVTPHTALPHDSLLRSHRDQRRKTAEYASNLCWLLSFIRALVEHRGKHCHYFLMKATFVKFEPSAMHLQWLWIKISMSMQANFCLWINLKICTNLWLFEWKESKNFAWCVWCVCLWEHRAQ